jgi:hypothetical protein
MADHYEVVGNAPGFGTRLLNSIKGIFVGIVFMIAAFGLLWWGEGRQNLAEFVKKGTLILSTQPATVAPGTLVKTAGRLRSDETINDDKYLNLGAQKFLKLSRDVAMYAWKEDKKTEKRGDKEVTTYDYRKEWTRMPSDSSRFYDGAGHVNPKMSEDDASFQVKTAMIGALVFEAEATDFHGAKELAVTETLLKKDAANQRQLSGGAVYIANGMSPVAGPRNAAITPEVGDLRLTYAYFPNDVDGSAVGDWDGKKIAPHRYRATETYLGAYPGSLEEFRARLQSEHTLMTWIIRIASFLMLWAGLNMILGPILMVMDSIPVVGGAGRFVISLFTGAVAFVLWLLTLVLANLWLALIIVAVLGVGLLIYGKMKKKTAGIAPTTAGV